MGIIYLKRGRDNIILWLIKQEFLKKVNWLQFRGKAGLSRKLQPIDFFDRPILNHNRRFPIFKLLINDNIFVFPVDHYILENDVF